jgi:hypothetical protein
MEQYVEIESEWVTPVFHCPVCGQVVFTADGGPASQPCEHVLFSWISQVGEFYNSAADIQEILDDDEGWHSPASGESLDRCPDTAVLFAFNSCEMGCGQVSLAVMHAIRFPDDANEGEENVR